jgi:hypothetical protein
MSTRFHIYCCARSSDTDRLQVDLMCSPEIANGAVGVSILWNQPSAAGAYSQAIETATADFLVFAHCDVYFPQGWFARLAWEADRLSHTDPDWAVAGVSSITPSGEVVGRIFDTSLEPVFPETSGVFGKSLATPVPIVSADELVLIVRRASGISFDPLLPEFHLYGTDIILAAERQGKRSYGLDMPLIHNAKPGLRLGPDYAKAYRYMVRKWRDRLPVPTTCVPLTANPIILAFDRLRVRYKAIFRRSTYSSHRLSDSRGKARELGFERLLAAPMVEARATSIRLASPASDPLSAQVRI